MHEPPHPPSSKRGTLVSKAMELDSASLNSCCVPGTDGCVFDLFIEHIVSS